MRAGVYAKGAKRSLSLVAEGPDESELVAGLRPYAAAFDPERGGVVVRRDPEQGSGVRFRPGRAGGEVMIALTGAARPPAFGRRQVSWRPLESEEGIVVEILDIGAEQPAAAEGLTPGPAEKDPVEAVVAGIVPGFAGEPEVRGGEPPEGLGGLSDGGFLREALERYLREEDPGVLVRALNDRVACSGGDLRLEVEDGRLHALRRVWERLA